MVDAIPALNTEKAVALFEKFGVFTKAELDSVSKSNMRPMQKRDQHRSKGNDRYCSKADHSGSYRYTTALAQSINAVKSACGADISVQTEILVEVSDLLADTKNALSKLEEVTAGGAAMAQGRAGSILSR